MESIGFRRTHIKQQLRLGIVTDHRRCIGVHGTSPETILRAVDTGVLPGVHDIYDDPSVPQAGNLYYYPYPSPRVLSMYSGRMRTLVANNDIPGSVRSAATRVSRAHSVLSRLNRSLDNPQYYRAAASVFYVDEDELPNIAAALEVSEDELVNVCRSVSSVRGVIFGINSSALDVYPDTHGDPGEPDRRLCTTSGFPVKYILGLKVLDQYSLKLLTDNL